MKLVGQLTKAVGTFDLRMAGDVPCTKVLAWLSRVESALELHFGVPKNIPHNRLLRMHDSKKKMPPR